MPPRRIAKITGLVLVALALDVVLSVTCWQSCAIWYASLDAGVEQKHGPTAVVVFYSDNLALRKDRLTLTRNLLDQYPEARVFAVGGARPRNNYYGSAEMADWLRSTGIEDTRITIDRNSFDTRGNVKAAIQMAHQAHINTLLLVSDPLHILRIDHLFGQAKGNVRLGYKLSGMESSVSQIVIRANYEIAAWAIELAPAGMRSSVLAWIGRT